MSPVLRVGCPMWANRDWVGRHLPASTKPGHELAAYARLRTAVEGNTIFYAVPDAAAVERWAAEVRHRAFEARGSHEARLDDLLRRHGANRVVIDTQPCLW